MGNLGLENVGNYAPHMGELHRRPVEFWLSAVLEHGRQAKFREERAPERGDLHDATAVNPQHIRLERTKGGITGAAQVAGSGGQTIGGGWQQAPVARFAAATLVSKSSAVSAAGQPLGGCVCSAAMNTSSIVSRSTTSASGCSSSSSWSRKGCSHGTSANEPSDLTCRAWCRRISRHSWSRSDTARRGTGHVPQTARDSARL